MSYAETEHQAYAVLIFLSYLSVFKKVLYGIDAVLYIEPCILVNSVSGQKCVAGGDKYISVHFNRTPVLLYFSCKAVVKAFEIIGIKIVKVYTVFLNKALYKWL